MYQTDYLFIFLLGQALLHLRLFEGVKKGEAAVEPSSVRPAQRRLRREST